MPMGLAFLWQSNGKDICLGGLAGLGGKKKPGDVCRVVRAPRGGGGGGGLQARPSQKMGSQFPCESGSKSCPSGNVSTQMVSFHHSGADWGVGIVMAPWDQSWERKEALGRFAGSPGPPRGAWGGGGLQAPPPQKLGPQFPCESGSKSCPSGNVTTQMERLGAPGAEGGVEALTTPWKHWEQPKVAPGEVCRLARTPRGRWGGGGPRPPPSRKGGAQFLWEIWGALFLDLLK